MSQLRKSRLRNRLKNHPIEPASTPQLELIDLNWAPASDLNLPVPSHATQQDSLLVWGSFLIIASILMFSFGIFATCFSPLLKPSGNQILDQIQRDRHYKYLLPLLWPVTLIAVIVNWGGFKFWRHAVAGR